MNRLAVKIKEARIKAGLTELQLAKKSGQTVSYIMQVESGKKIVNEAIADKILKSLGTKEEFVEVEKEVEKPKEVTRPASQQGTVVVTPNQTWSDALAGVIKKYPIYELTSKKITEYKELPILSKKIEGHHPDKIMFFRVSNNDMEAFRIQKNDVITVFETKDIQNDGIYIFEYAGMKIIRQLRKEAGKKVRLSKRVNDSDPMMVDQAKVKLIGRVIKSEFNI